MSVAAERFERAAILGVAMAEETRRILRSHLRPAEVSADGTVLVNVPFPDSAVLRVVLEVATECFARAGASPEQARREALESVLQLAGPETETRRDMG
ncbi:hypothetical protein ACIBH1_05775 [Nonomuraea sp. NPDC050663]|uniref:hypothetical protein n=1 Tax=Nonomuraea sp. NPDC050663 TaxID=3364370 RepID=UPI0037ACF465